MTSNQVPISVQQIDHVHLVVVDRRDAARWYGEVFGFAVVTEFEEWIEIPDGPLMLSCGERTKLALHAGAPLNDPAIADRSTVAFLVSGEAFISFLDNLSSLQLHRRGGGVLTRADWVDHEKAFSLYFSDPWGNALEVTTYDHAHVRQGVSASPPGQ